MEAATWPTNARGVWIGGIFSGLVSGAAMIALAMLWYGAVGVGFLTPLRLIGATFMPASSTGMGPVVVGLAFHFFNSAVLGLLFAAFFRYSTPLVAAVSGIVYGIFIWALGTFAVVPLVDAPLWRSFRATGPAWFIAHALFGVVLGWAPILVSRLSKPRVVEAFTAPEKAA